MWRKFFHDAALSIEKRKQKTAEAALLLPLSCLIGERSARSEGTLVTYQPPPVCFEDVIHPSDHDRNSSVNAFFCVNRNLFCGAPPSPPFPPDY